MNNSYVYFSLQAQIRALKTDSMLKIVLKEYKALTKIFLLYLVDVFLKYIRINNHTIKLINI